jgi:hypothetical protein
VGAGGRSGLLWAVASDGRARAASERSSANENGPRYVDKTRHETRGRRGKAGRELAQEQLQLHVSSGCSARALGRGLFYSSDPLATGAG